MTAPDLALRVGFRGISSAAAAPGERPCALKLRPISRAHSYVENQQLGAGPLRFRCLLCPGRVRSRLAELAAYPPGLGSFPAIAIFALRCAGQGTLAPNLLERSLAIVDAGGATPCRSPRDAGHADRGQRSTDPGNGTKRTGADRTRSQSFARSPTQSTDTQARQIIPARFQRVISRLPSRNSPANRRA